MYNKKQTIHYCTILSAGQWDFILDGRAAIDRQKCLHRLMTVAVRTKTVRHIKGVEIVLKVGQAAASDVELAEYMGCNRKTIGKLIDSFNRLGMLTTRTNNRTSVHTLHFLTGWYVDGVLLTNPHYVKPAANAKGQADGTRTPNPNEMLLQNGECTMQDNHQCREQETDTTESRAAALSSSLCSPVVSDSSEDRVDAEDKADNSHTGDNGNWQHGNNPAESPEEAQDGTIGGVDDPDIGRRD